MSQHQSTSCPNCSESVTSDQHWCLACGTRLLHRTEVRRPGWKSAFSITSLTILLVLGGSVAAYATLSKDAEGEGAKPAPPAANPAVAQAAPPQTPYAETQTAQNKNKKLTTVKNPLGNRNLQGNGSNFNPNSRFPNGTGGGGFTPGGTGRAAVTKPPPVPVNLEPNDIEVFDPLARPGAEYGDGEGTNNLIDKDEESYWNVAIPEDGKNVDVGLLIEPRAPQVFTELSLKTFTEGFSILVYGTNNEDPPDDLKNKSWKLLAKKNKIKADQKVALNKRISGKSFRFLLIWFTKLGNKTTAQADSMVAVNELGLLAEASSTSNTTTNTQNNTSNQQSGNNNQQNENSGTSTSQKTK